MLSNDDPLINQPQQSEHRIAYHRQMDDLTTGILRLGAMACETIPRGTEAILSGNLSDAQAVIDADDAADELSAELEEQCLFIMARQSPMAGELRRLVTCLHMISELERSADLMVNVCKASRRMFGQTLTPQIRGLIASMSKEANKLLRLSLDAFADRNVSLAAALGDIDDELDQLNRDMVEAIFHPDGQHEIELAGAVQLALIARYYERVGDHAVNIGERVIYMVTGDHHLAQSGDGDADGEASGGNEASGGDESTQE